MSGIRLKGFSGIIPRIPTSDLPLNSASIAENIDFSYGELRPLKGGYKLKDLSSAAMSVFSEDGLRFYTWQEDVDAAISPLQNGPAADRLYYTTDTDFRVTSRSLASINGSTPSVSFRVGVPKPTQKMQINVEHPKAPTPEVAKVDAKPEDTYQTRLATAQEAANALTKANTKIDKETRVYAYTYANIYKEEGPPSDPVSIEVVAQTYLGVTTYSKVTLAVFFDGSDQYVPINSARVYRTSGSGRGADFYFTMSISGSSGQVTSGDAVKPGDMNEVLTSLDAYPPDPLLKGLINVGNGILAAWKGNEMWFSDPYRPWSWPPSNVKTLKYSIVGAIRHGTGALVTTVGSPSIFTGVSGDSMTEIPLDIPQAGVSKWAMLSMDGMVLYASHDGIVAINGGQPDIRMSEKYFTREVWRARYGNGLKAMQFAYYDGCLVVFSKTNAFPAFMIQLQEANGAMTDLPGLVAKTALVLTTSDQMYTINGTGLYQFGGGNDLPIRWKTGDLVIPAPGVLAMAQAECTGTFTVKFSQNGVLGYTKELTAGVTTFRLPAQPIDGHAGLPACDRWEIEISGKGIFKFLKCANSGRALSGM